MWNSIRQPGVRGWLVICFHRCHYLHSLRRRLLHGLDRCSTLLHVWLHCLSVRFCFSIVQIKELSLGIDECYWCCRLQLLHSLQCRKDQHISRCVKTTQGKKSRKKAIGNTTLEHSQLKLLLVHQIYIFMAIIHSAQLKIRAMKINQFFSVAKKMFWIQGLLSALRVQKDNLAHMVFCHPGS